MINIKRIERSSSSSSKEELEVSPGELGKELNFHRKRRREKRFDISSSVQSAGGEKREKRERKSIY